MKDRDKYERPATATVRVVICVLLALSIVSCRAQSDSKPPESRTLRLATTTSTDNSGLLEVLLPPFTAHTGIRVDVISVGTGKALAHGRAGDVDLVLVHAKSAENLFVSEGHGINRRDVMYNDFIIVGPANDPAEIADLETIAQVLSKLATSGQPFVSRGDDSGTHKRELQLWKNAGVTPFGDWYLDVGQAMGATLTITDEKNAYCLADRGTWLAHQKHLDLKVLFSGDSSLHNPYGVIPVNPARHPHVHYVEAMAFTGWLTSPEGQKLIRDFRIGDQALFIPLAIQNPGDSH